MEWHRYLNNRHLLFFCTHAIILLYSVVAGYTWPVFGRQWRAEMLDEHVGTVQVEDCVLSRIS